MNRGRAVLYLLLAVVALAAAVLSFSALRDLAIVCGFDGRLAWLLPVVIDAGAAAGSLAWLGSAAPSARTYGRALALVLLASSVGGNALGHGLAAYELRPHWLVVVGVSAVAPAVLGALVHLVVLAARPVVPAVPGPPTEQGEHADGPVLAVSVPGGEHVGDEREPAGAAVLATVPTVPTVPEHDEHEDESVPARRGTDAEIVEHLREHGLPSRRQLNKVLVCGLARYERLLAEAREPGLRRVQ